jgi:hypothetical protein
MIKHVYWSALCTVPSCGLLYVQYRPAVCFMYSTLYSCPILMKLEFSRQIFQKYKIPCNSVQSGPWHRGAMTRLIVAYRNFANVPPNDNELHQAVTHQKPRITAPLTQTVLQTWQVAIPADGTNKSDLHAQRHEQHTNSENACYHPVQYLSSSRA